MVDCAGSCGKTDMLHGYFYCTKCGRVFCSACMKGDPNFCPACKAEMTEVVETYGAPYGRCWCKLPLVKNPRDAKSKRGFCTLHGYSTEKTATATR